MNNSEVPAERISSNHPTGEPLRGEPPSVQTSFGSVRTKCYRPAKKKGRRRFSADYKLRILAEAEACTKPGQIGALLRREELYASNLAAWRRQRDQGLMAAMTPKKRGRKSKGDHGLTSRGILLEKENRQLKKRLRATEQAIDIQKKNLRQAWKHPKFSMKEKELVMGVALVLSDEIGKKAACEALQVSRATLYRFIRRKACQFTKPSEE